MYKIVQMMSKSWTRMKENTGYVSLPLHGRKIVWLVRNAGEWVVEEFFAEHALNRWAYTTDFMLYFENDLQHEFSEKRDILG